MLIRGGTVWGEEGGRRADVRVEGERIAEVGALAPRRDEEVVDASGLDVLPGLIDVHVHVDDRIDGLELADSFASASEIAVRNGITAFAGFVTQERGESLGRAVDRCLARASGRSHCDYTFHLTPTAWSWADGEIGALVRQGFVTFKLYTTYREAGLFTSYARLREAMARLTSLGARLLVHCEDDDTLAAVGDVGLPVGDARSHARRRPPEAETKAVGRVLTLARETGCPVHIVHVSTADAAAAVETMRGRHPVSCETAPHYLVLDESALARRDGYRFLCTPPLRSAATRARVEAAAAEGAFDLLATDHCAFTRADKDRHANDVRRVPKGVAGIGALVPLAHELLVDRHARPLSDLVRMLAANPARLLGVFPRKGAIAAGSDADLVVLGRGSVPRAVVSSLADCHETYPGRTTTLAFRRVLVRGCEVVRDGTLVERPPPGRCLASV